MGAVRRSERSGVSVVGQGVGFAFVAMGLLLALVRPSLARLEGLWRLAEAAMDWLEGASFGPDLSILGT